MANKNSVINKKINILVIDFRNFLNKKENNEHGRDDYRKPGRD